MSTSIASGSRSCLLRLSPKHFPKRVPIRCCGILMVFFRRFVRDTLIRDYDDDNDIYVADTGGSHARRY